MTAYNLINRKFRSFVCFFIFFVIAAPLFSLGTQEVSAHSIRGRGTDPWDLKPFTAPVAEILSAADAVDIEDATQAKILLREDVYTVYKDNTIGQQYRWVYQVLDEKGVENWASTSVGWSPWYQNRPEIKVRVCHPDGKDYFIDPATLVESAAASYSEKIYSDSRLLGGPLPHITVGAVVEEYSEVIDFKPFFAAGSIQRINWFRGVPMAKRRVVIRIEQGADITFEAIGLDHLNPTQKTVSGFEEWVYVDDDVKKLDSIEPSLPPAVDPLAHIVFTTGKSWQAVSDLYLSEVNQAVGDISLKNLVDPLKKETENDTIISIVNFLNEKVRYTGMELGKNALIPFSPLETLERGWGDCKDKSVLLARLLTDAGIPAYPALVRTNSERDINPNMPGLGSFNHCIVFVDGEQTLWIDPTSDFLTPGVLGVYEQDRHALIIRQGTEGLVKTSRMTGDDNLVEESYDYYLSEKGYADLGIELVYHGNRASSMRGLYNWKSKEELEEGLKRSITKSFRFGEIDSFEFSDPTDLSVPFKVTARVSEMGRAGTEFVTAIAAVMQNEMLSYLPGYFLIEPKEDEERTSPYYFSQPVTLHKIYRIHIPVGFIPQEVPDSEEIQIGLFTLDKKVSYSKEDQLITLDMTLSISQEELTAEDAFSLKKNASGFSRQSESITLNFLHEGEQLLKAEDYQGSLAKYREYAVREDAGAIDHMRLAKAYLNARFGTLAREEINKAIELDPKNSIAWYLKGLIYQNNEFGRILQSGFDLDLSVAAFKEAIVLDPENYDYQNQLVEMLCYNKQGVKFASDSYTAEAVGVLEQLIVDDKDNEEKYKNSLLFAAWFAGKYDKVAEVASSISNEKLKKLFNALSLYFNSGNDAMLEEVNKVYTADEVKGAWQQIAQLLIDKRQYGEAAQLMRMAAAGSESAFDLEYQADLISAVTLQDRSMFGDSTVEGLIKRFFSDLFNADGVDFSLLETHLTPALYNQLIDNENSSGLGFFYDVFVKNSLSAFNHSESMMDRFFSGVTFHIEQEGEVAFKVKVNLQEAGFRGSLFFLVIKNGDQLRIAGFNENIEGIGDALVDLYDAGELDAVKKSISWLDKLFKPETVRVGEPLGFFPFLSFADEVGLEKSDDIRLILAAVAAETKGSLKSVQPLLAIAGNSDDMKDVFASASLIKYYSENQDVENIYKYSQLVYDEFPDSTNATLYYMRSLLLTDQSAKAEALLVEKEAADWDDGKLGALYHDYFSYTIDYEGFSKYIEKLEGEGSATATHYNLISWLSLFLEEGPQPKDFLYARKAVKMTEAKNAAILHTLACLYADAGRCNEAVKLLDDLEELSPSGRYSSADWYLYGRIAEEYGIPESAKIAYKSVVDLDDLISVPVSCWTLVQERLQEMAE